MPKKVVPAELRNRVSKFNILLNFFVFDKLLFVIFIKNKLKFHMIKKFSSPKIRNRQFVFTPKIEYKLVAKRCEANPSNLQFPMWCPRRESATTRKYFDSLRSQNTNEPQPPLGGSPPFVSEFRSRLHVALFRFSSSVAKI
ncbi:hypothetical protein A2Z61_01110 [Candidatus Campbellbacteria bacterium RIFCSPLOWO2_02_35_12]|uniref:Uncharacterized protein n=1 Tax=Candidatus Campbellbacteria bacterium RIFCSPLOWO2_02_35_12 TaxID=1797580 RepID=A0A1F5EFX1_9BACT|nr:MAG: hypothetical protein A2Z61_01110 [Candidatus Campbellbacteria bacterium RIFCSPLOWO2_02_35_12]